MIELISFNFAIHKGNKDSFRQPTSAECQSSANSGYSYASNLSRFESYLISNGTYVGSKSPYSMMAKFKKASPTALQMNFMAQQTVQMGKSLGKQ